MLASISNLFRAKPTLGGTYRGRNHKLEHAAATLMFKMINADGSIDQQELTHTAEILRKQFGLSSRSLKSLSKSAFKTAVKSDSDKKKKITQEICDHWGNANRMKLLEHLWVIAFADNRVDPAEENLIREIAAAIYMTETQVIQAYENARNALGIEDF